LEAHNNIDIAISEYNKAVYELQRNIDEKVKARSEKDYEILEASLLGELEKNVYKNAFYLDEINPLVFISIQQLTLNKIFYLDKRILKINEVTHNGVRYFILSTASALLCTLDKAVANEDKFLRTIESLANESQLIEKFLITHKLLSQMQEKADTFKKSLKDNVNEMTISSVVKGLCDTCPHEL
jgi:hypothetical protein